MTLSNEQLTAIYNKANGITDKNPPISTKFIFNAMQAAYASGLAEGRKQVVAYRMTKPCEKHQGKAWIGVAVITPAVETYCPICEGQQEMAAAPEPKP